MSLVRIMFDGRNIQTGAYTNICRTIFTLGTDNLKVLSHQFLDQRNVLVLMAQNNCPQFVAINGLNEHSTILRRIDKANDQINLMVSSFTKKSSLCSNHQNENSALIIIFIEIIPHRRKAGYV